MSRSWIGIIVAVAVLVLAAALLARALGRYDLEEVGAALVRLPWRQLIAAALFTLASYALLTAVDFMAIRYAGRRLSYPKVALASFIALSIGHSLGFAALSSGAVRFRFYRRWGLSVGEIARVLVFCGLTVLLGYSTVGGVALAASADWLPKLTQVPHGMLLPISVLALSVPVLYFGAVWFARPVRLGRFHIAPPALALSLGQFLAGGLDVLLVSGVLHQALGGAEAIPYGTVLTVYVAAAVAGMLAHVPGGLGVVEAVMLAALPGPQTLAGLVAFRAIYYLIPLGLGGVALGAFELAIRSRARTPR